MIDKKKILDLLDEKFATQPDSHTKCMIADAFLELLSNYTVKEKQMIFDCIIVDGASRATSVREMDNLKKTAEELGFILVPRLLEDRNTFEQLLKDVIISIRRKEYHDSRRRNGEVQLGVEEQFWNYFGRDKTYPDFIIPQHEKDIGFSDEFVEALTEYLIIGDWYKFESLENWYKQGEIIEVGRCSNLNDVAILIPAFFGDGDATVLCSEIDRIVYGGKGEINIFKTFRLEEQ